MPESESPRRLNWGCGDHTRPGWINSDVKAASGVDLVADIRRGLPLRSESIDYVVSVHALPELCYDEQVPALEELLRVLKPGGALRLVLPDAERAARAYIEGDDDYFTLVEEDAHTPGGRFVTQILWYGYSRTIFTSDFAIELLERSGFGDIALCHPDQTVTRFAGIVELDNREAESLYVEGFRPPRRAQWLRHGYNHRPSMDANIDVTAVSVSSNDSGDLLASHLDSPAVGTTVEGSDLRIVGWVLGKRVAAKEIEVTSEHDVVGRTTVSIPRGGVTEEYPDAAGSDTAGFDLVMSAAGNGPSELLITVVFEDGSRAQLCTINVNVYRQEVQSTMLAR